MVATDDNMIVGRTADFERDQSLETVLREINAVIPGTLQPPYSAPRMPVVLIVGAPRSGTTLMSQWLAASGLFAYPSNLIARFYGNPYFGGKVQQALLTFDKNRQIFTDDQNLSFSSDLGRTDGALAPSEFWYFWRQYFQFGDINYLTAEEQKDVDVDGFLTGLAGLEAAQCLPIVMKAMNLNWNLPYLDSIIPHVLFINVEREPLYNVQSLVGARERFFDDRSRWYSFKPPAYPELAEKSPLEQVVGQIYHNRAGVREGLSHVNSSRQMTVDYTTFCNDPQSVMSMIKTKFADQGFKIDAAYDGPERFSESRALKLTDSEIETIKTVIEQYKF